MAPCASLQERTRRQPRIRDNDCVIRRRRPGVVPPKTSSMWARNHPIAEAACFHCQLQYHGQSKNITPWQRILRLCFLYETSYSKYLQYIQPLWSFPSNGLCYRAAWPYLPRSPLQHLKAEEVDIHLVVLRHGVANALGTISNKLGRLCVARTIDGSSIPLLRSIGCRLRSGKTHDIGPLLHSLGIYSYP